MNKNKGVSLFQYIIIIVLILLVSVPLLIIYGEKIKSAIMGMVNVQGNINSQMNMNSPETIAAGKVKAGDFGGTPDKPVEACASNVCSIDYGTFVLNGIPADFGSVVESAGSSGGTDAIAAIIEQAVQALEDQGNNVGAQEFRKFANLAFFEADLKKAVEDNARSCLPGRGDDMPVAEQVACFNHFYNGQNNGMDFPQMLPELPLSLSTILPDYDPTPTSPPAGPGLPPSQQTPLSCSDINNYVRNDYARSIMNSNQAEFNSNSTKYPSFAMVTLYNNIQNQTNATYPPEIRTIASRLYQCISDVSFESSLISQRIGSNGANSTLDRYDVFDGNHIGEVLSRSELDLSEILSPQYGDNIDLRAMLLCTTGHHYVDGVGCQ